MFKKPVVYIMASQRNGTLYIGVTSNLAQRAYQHKNKLIAGFSQKYNCTQLVYYELFETMVQAIEREKKLKNKKRSNKIALIETKNPEWKDLYTELFL